MTRYASVSCPSVFMQLAGLVDGSAAMEPPVSFRYSFAAVCPVANIFRMGATEVIREKSFAAAFRMDASDAPSISQEASTSQSAMPCDRSISRFSSTECGSGTESTADSTFQKRFCGCP